MSSVIAAPIGGRLLRTRALVHESPREHERTRLRRYLWVTALQALENIAGSPAETEARAMYQEEADYCRSINDFVTFDLFKALMTDEEGHIDFLETQLDLIERIGIENYSQSHLGGFSED